MYLDEKSYTSPPAETKPDIFALPTLIAWLEKQPARKEYSFFNVQVKCLICQYMTDHGIGHRFGDGQYAKFTERTDWGHLIAGSPPYTFGGALARARALLP